MHTISGEKYFTLLGEKVEEGVKSVVSATLAEEMGKSFTKHGEPYKEKREEILNKIRAADAGEEVPEDETEEDPLEKISYIHLKNIRILSLPGAPRVNPEWVIWRGRTDRIYSFLYGAANVS